MSERNRENGFRFPVFHVPHDGRQIRARLSGLCVPEETIRSYHRRMSDRWVTKLVPFQYLSGDHLVRFPFSRLQCDVERYLGAEEVMEKYGMGVCYWKAYDGTVIREQSGVFGELMPYYEKHHRKMNQICENHSRVLLIDLHSYHDEIIPSGFLLPGRKMPDLCIGTDERFTTPDMAELICSRFTEAGFTADVNYPYSGVYVPEGVAEGWCGCDFAGFMLEFHRRTYLDKDDNLVPEKAEKIRGIIERIVEDCRKI